MKEVQPNILFNISKQTLPEPIHSVHDDESSRVFAVFWQIYMLIDSCGEVAQTQLESHGSKRKTNMLSC